MPTDPEAELIVKAQIHAGGRGKGFFQDNETRGVHICTECVRRVTQGRVFASAASLHVCAHVIVVPAACRAEEAAGYVAKMLGGTLTTKQTGPEGQLCTKVLINEGIFIEKELYFAILMDRAFNGPVVVTSKMGGMDIEGVAEEHPDEIMSTPIDIVEGMTDAQARDIATGLGFEGDSVAVVRVRVLVCVFGAVCCLPACVFLKREAGSC